MTEALGLGKFYLHVRCCVVSAHANPCYSRWLVHSLASYYGLRTWSVTAGNPPRREAYVGIDPVALERRHRSQLGHPINPGLNVLPRPLWVSV
jgi:hypothetical protein